MRSFFVNVNVSNVSGGSGRHCLRGENSSSSSLSGKKTLKFHCQVSMELGELDADEDKLVGDEGELDGDEDELDGDEDELDGDEDELVGDEDEFDGDIDIFSGMLSE